MAATSFHPLTFMRKFFSHPLSFGATRSRKRLKRYVICEATLLQDLRKDIEKIKKILLLHKSGNRDILLKHYRQEAKRDEQQAERIERRLNYLLLKVEESIDSSSGMYLHTPGLLRKIKQEIDIAGKNLIKLISWNGELHQLFKEKVIEWDKVDATVRKTYGTKNGAVPGIFSLLAALDQLERLDASVQSRRTVVKGLAAGVAGAAVLAYSASALAQEIADRWASLDEAQIIGAVFYACEAVEKEREASTRRISQNPLYTPHADYTHFNRSGPWNHSAILEEAETEKEGAEYGAREVSLFEKQRDEARKSRQPTDLDVSITERSLVTLANLAGRRRVKGKILVPKHFPGGSPNLELTEELAVSFRGDSSSLLYLKPFRDLIHSGLAQALMIAHANYPDLEKEFLYNPFDKKVAKELSSLGLHEEVYWKWVITRPASVSPSVIRMLLKGALRFKGFIIPDALNMRSIIIKCKELFDHLNVNELIPKNVFENTLKDILLIYSGIDFFLLNEHPGDTTFIAEYYEEHPFFRECFDASFGNYLTLLSLIGKPLPIVRSTKDKVNVLIKNKKCKFYPEQDAWDRSGVIHRTFRSHFLVHLYGDKRILVH